MPILPLLLGGWLLIFPPPAIDAKGNIIHNPPPVPLHDWEQAGAFDTVKECEAKRGYILDVAMEQVRTASANPKKQKPNPALNALLAAQMAARCLPTEAVYPAAKEPQ